MWSFRYTFEKWRCRRDVEKLELKIDSLDDSDAIEGIKRLIKLRGSLAAKDFYLYFGKGCLK